MPKRISVSQFKSKIRQAQRNQKQAIDKYNREARKHNQKVKSAVNKYNFEARKYNARVRANRRRIEAELRAIRSRSTGMRNRALSQSAISLNSSYEVLDSREAILGKSGSSAYFLDLSERENANALSLANALEGESDQDQEQTDPSSLLKTEIDEMLVAISPELSERWKGALFALNPENPDAARHFCTSAREIFVQILDMNAPDEEVRSLISECNITDAGRPTRKEKIKFLLMKADLLDDAAVDFVDEDVKNVLTLFRVFNEGTHGTSGKYRINQLVSIKERVENGISYLTTIANYT